jgi:tetratricopeptide (TPR) repeat protein
VVISSTATFEGPIYSADTIRRLAQASNSEQDSRWHTRLGWVLTIYEHLEDGCEEFTLALHLDPDNFRAQMWLAEAFAKQGKLNLAIEASLTTLNHCPPDLQFVIRDIWSNIRKWRYELGDEEGAIEATKASFATGEEGPYGNLINFQMLHDLRQHQLIIDMAKTLDEIPSRQVPGSLLDAFVRECCPYIVLGYAANAVGQLEYIDRIFRRAISNASHENNILGERRQRANYGWFVFAFKRDESKALEICKAVVSEYLASPPAKGFFQWDDRDSRQLAESLLIQIYLRKAIAGHPDASTVWFTELQNLLQRLEALKMQEAEASIYKNEGSSATALWHRLHGQPDVAKRLLSELVLEGLRILTDADPDNDIQGYVILGKALLTFGDRRNASVAFAVAGAPPNSFEKLKQQDREETPIPVNAAEATLTQPSTEPSDPTSAAGAARANPAGSDVAEQEDPASYLPYGCAGECSRKTKTWTAYYRCEYCYDTGFCDECVELVKASKLPFRVCDSSHPFLQVYPIDLDMADVGASVDNGLIVPRAEWLDMLRREWMADKVYQVYSPRVVRS